MFQQVYKDGGVVIYRLSRPSADGDEVNHWFEVFRLKHHSPDIYHPDAYEVYPADESFGIWAWSCSSPKCVEKVLKREFPDENCDEISHICCRGVTN